MTRQPVWDFAVEYRKAFPKRERCPQCGAGVDKVTPRDGGCIEETVYAGNSGRPRRIVRPATFYACMTCEWCEEA